ncbi:hypothetical protein UFOVP218_5 [uncultured Caudovirales phage]|uniref:Uncharacterized protein n=1 Tax=uncultured Caudovirales phage TaxID=2100421 RepID=A0A6J7WKL9_9CAUD|nr:hypothetical protein UFOVP218_5 [uncultured Caudovirales phage]
MTSKITATTAGLQYAPDTSGALELQVAGGTTAVVLNTNGALGVGSTPSYGTTGQALISAGTGSAPTWGSAGLSTGKSIAMSLIFGF